jgi:uncharacterized protein
MIAPLPVAPRLLSLDVIRGVAVMGIFSVNVIAFAMIEPAYMNPGAFGGHRGADLVMWLANYVLIDGKMRSLFSMLFGASMLLVIDRAEASGRSPAKVHYARMVTLLGFGLLHFYFIWGGDILALYAMVGMVAFLFRNSSVEKLLAIGTMLMLATAATFSFGAMQMRQADVAAHRAGATPREIARWNDNIGFLVSVPSESAKVTRISRSPFAVRAKYMLTERASDPLTTALAFGVPTLGLMLFGMAGYRSGFLTGGWSRRRYRQVAAITLGAGGLATLALGMWVVASNFHVVTIFFAFLGLGGPIELAMAFGYAALIILAIRPGGTLTGRIGAVGRTAFSNYLGTSLVAAGIFYGDGLGLFGRVSRAEAWLFVPVVWLLMLAWSKPWLDRFAYGPFEWAWRSLSRWSFEPMRKRPLDRAVLNSPARVDTL